MLVRNYNTNWNVSVVKLLLTKGEILDRNFSIKYKFKDELK